MILLSEFEAGEANFKDTKCLEGVVAMRYTINGKNFEVSNRLRDAAVDKLGKLEKYFSEETEVQVAFSAVKQDHIIEVTIPIKGTIVRAEENGETIYAALDQAVDVLERQLLKHRKKLVNRHRHHGTFRTTFVEEFHDDDEGIEIVRSKRFPVKPMDAEEACMEMELLGHSFFVFKDRDTDEIGVVYKRKDGRFGLISPEE